MKSAGFEKAFISFFFYPFTFSKPALFIIFGTYYNQVKKWLKLLKAGTFVLFQHFNMHAYMMRLFFGASKKKKCGIKKPALFSIFRTNHEWVKKKKINK